MNWSSATTNLGPENSMKFFLSDRKFNVENLLKITIQWHTKFSGRIFSEENSMSEN